MDSDSTSSIPENEFEDESKLDKEEGAYSSNEFSQPKLYEESYEELLSPDHSFMTASHCKNKSLQLHCADCNVNHCIMWRRLTEDKLVCNFCHLKRIKCSSSSINGKNAGCISKGKELQAVRISSRKNKAKKKFGNGFVSIIKNGSTKSRRNLFKRKPLKSVDGCGSIITSKAVYHNGLLFQVGDIVSTFDIEGEVFFAQLRGFLQDDYCEKFCVVTWLIPKIPQPKVFDPMLFLPGLDEDIPRPMDCFDFVCHAPSDLYKSRILHPPYLKSQANLCNLIEAAELIEDLSNGLQQEAENRIETLLGSIASEENNEK